MEDIMSKTIHAVHSGITVGGFVLRRGDTITLTDAQVADTLDRDGRSYLDMTDAEQITRWGEVKFREGDAPADLAPWQDDVLARSGARDTERESALRIADRAERTAALQAIDEKYGRPATQWSLSTVPPTNGGV